MVCMVVGRGKVACCPWLCPGGCRQAGETMDQGSAGPAWRLCPRPLLHFSLPLKGSMLSRLPNSTVSSRGSS